VTGIEARAARKLSPTARKVGGEDPPQASTKKKARATSERAAATSV